MAMNSDVADSIMQRTGVCVINEGEFSAAMIRQASYSPQVVFSLLMRYWAMAGR